MGSALLGTPPTLPSTRESNGNNERRATLTGFYYDATDTAPFCLQLTASLAHITALRLTGILQDSHRMYCGHLGPMLGEWPTREWPWWPTVNLVPDVDMARGIVRLIAPNVRDDLDDVPEAAGYTAAWIGGAA